MPLQLNASANYTYLAHQLNSLVNEPNRLQSLRYASHTNEQPALAYCVNFPRLELVLNGELSMLIANHNDQQQTFLQTPHTALFVPANGWNEPLWQEPATTLSILFGKQQLGFSIMTWDGQQFEAPRKYHIARRGPRTAAFILQALTELMWRPEDQRSGLLLVRSLLSSALDLLQHPAQTLSRSQTLFEAVRAYIEENYRTALSRESVAEAFYISPSYLSHLFQKEAKLRFTEYLNQVRLEHAKALLKQYDMKVKEIAHQCGFNDSNYFCRLFKQQTNRSPSQYRVQYRSQQH